MLPNVYFQRMVSAVVKESGICKATVEQVLPAVFDVIRRELVEGRYHCVPIESFGTFALVDIPERQHLYTYKDIHEMRTLPPTKRLKFAPTRNLRREADEGRYDPTRRAFTRHPKDPAIRKRKDMEYQPMKSGIHKGRTTVLPPNGNP